MSMMNYYYYCYYYSMFEFRMQPNHLDLKHSKLIEKCSQTFVLHEEGLIWKD